MTTIQLAAGYLKKCEDRLAMMEVLMDRQAWSDVVDEDDAEQAFAYARQAAAALKLVLKAD